MSSEDGGPRSMVIRDYCAGGLFLQYPSGSQSPAFQEPLPESLTITFHDPASDGTCRFAANPVRTTEDGIAVAFEGPRLDLVAVLAVMAQAQSKPDRPAEAATINPDRADYIVGLCRRAIRDEAHRWIPAYINTLIGYLEDLAKRARSASVADAFRHASNTLSDQRALWADAFIGAIERRADTLRDGTAEGKDSADNDRTDELPAPPSIEELELIRETETQLAEPLERLNQRLNRLLGTGLDKPTNPLGPASLMDCLRGTLPLEEPPVAIKRVVYRHFQRYVLSQLGSFYERLEQTLDEPDRLLERPSRDAEAEGTDTHAYSPKAPPGRD